MFLPFLLFAAVELTSKKKLLCWVLPEFVYSVLAVTEVTSKNKFLSYQ